VRKASEAKNAALAVKPQLFRYRRSFIAMLTDSHTQTSIRACFAVVLALILTVAFAATAQARDSNAPRGASNRWLPCEEWVMMHWIPYDENDFEKLTGVKSSRVLNWIRDDQHHRLRRLVERKGYTVDEAVDKLTAPRIGKVSDAKLAQLKKRTRDMLTQGHLSQHVLFHHFHDPVIGTHSRQIFGLTRGEYTLARRHGFSPARMGWHTGRSKYQIKSAAIKVMRAEMRKAVKRGDISRSEASRFNHRQWRYANRWLHQDLKLGKKGKFPDHARAKKFTKRKELFCSLFVSKRNDGREPEATTPAAAKKD
jgi:hypothetical protein